MGANSGINGSVADNQGLCQSKRESDTKIENIVQKKTLEFDDSDDIKPMVGAQLESNPERLSPILAIENESMTDNMIDVSIQENVVEMGNITDRNILSAESEAFFWDWILQT